MTVQDAFETLSDPVKRAAYDRELNMQYAPRQDPTADGGPGQSHHGEASEKTGPAAEHRSTAYGGPGQSYRDETSGDAQPATDQEPFAHTEQAPQHTTGVDEKGASYTPAGRPTFAANTKNGRGHTSRSGLPLVLATTVIGVLLGIFWLARISSGSPQNEWKNATYTMTCDGLVGRFDITLTDGRAKIPGAGSSYDHIDVQYETSVNGDMTSDGQPETAVLLSCSPQPSFYDLVEEVQVFAGVPGNQYLLGVVPSTSTLGRSAHLRPRYVSTELGIAGGQLSAGMKFYRPTDSYASGPSEHRTIVWGWDVKAKWFVQLKPESLESITDGQLNAELVFRGSSYQKTPGTNYAPFDGPAEREEQIRHALPGVLGAELAPGRELWAAALTRGGWMDPKTAV
jgi:hypothetical protein